VDGEPEPGPFFSNALKSKWIWPINVIWEGVVDDELAELECEWFEFECDDFELVGFNTFFI
jgi:hypothetical protein